MVPSTGLSEVTSDWDCLKRARQGDDSAWRELFGRHQASLLNMATLITGSPDSAQDVIQESFLQLLKNRGENSAGSFRAYVAKIAYHLALKERARRSHRSSLQNLDVSDGNPSALEAAIRDDRQREVAGAIGSLAEDQRRILILRFYGEFSYEHIAEITRIPLGTVKSRIFYAVKACRERLLMKGLDHETL